MKHIVLYLFIALGFIACSKSQEDKLSEIREFEKSEKTGTSEGLAKLAKLHEAYGKEYKDEAANNYLYAAAQYYFYENKNIEAIPLLSEYISRDDSSERFRNAAINLAMLLGKATEFDKADELISEVLDKDLPTAAQWQDIIGLYETKVKAEANLKPNDYERLAMAYTAVGRFSDATKSLDAAISEFPKYENRGNLIYRAGFIGWEYLKDTEVATKYYNQFLSEYPSDPKANEVKQILKSGMLEMSDEAILEMLKGKTK